MGAPQNLMKQSQSIRTYTKNFTLSSVTLLTGLKIVL